MVLFAIVVGGLGAIIGLIAYGVICLCGECRKPPKINVDYSHYSESEKDKLLKEKDKLLEEKEKEIKMLTMELNGGYWCDSSNSNHISKEEISREVSKGIRDGIARSQMEHGESIGNYGLSDLFFD